MADPQHPDTWERRCALWRAGMGPDPGPPPDPQRPDIPALVERHADVRNRVCDVMSGKRTPVMRIPADRERDDDLVVCDWIDAAAAALRTLARQVEDEEVRATAAFLAESGNERVRESASLLARLARDREDAVNKQGAAHTAMVVLGDALDEARDRATRAEQEAARLRDAADRWRKMIVEALDKGGFHPHQMLEYLGPAIERALAAAAGAEEPQ